MSVRVRLAPSPTGNLHIGTARTAVFNWLYARHHGGKFILRIEDTDLERSRPEYTQNILDGLTWLGLTWDEGPFYQSQRLENYTQATQKLLDAGLAYRCYCSEAELDEMRTAQKARKEAPRYDNRHRNLTPEQQAAYEAEGRQPVIRFKIDDQREITWHDLVRGPVTWKGSDLGGDMVIARAAAGGKIGQPLYNMAVVIDDIDMQITHVIRGEDHIANTAKQILLYEALGAKIPEFSHTPLILNKEGRKLSKRDSVTSISDFQAMGFTPEGLVNYMTLLGWTAPDSTQEIFTLPEAAQLFSFDRVNQAGAKFDWDKLDWVNSQYIKKMTTAQLTDLLIPYYQAAGYQFDATGDRPWLEQITELIAPSLTRLSQAVEMTKFFFQPNIELDEEASQLLEQADAQAAIGEIVKLLPAQDQPFTSADAQQIMKRLTQQQKMKKGVVMRSLRAVLTGAVHGPDLIQSWLILHQKGLDQQRLQKVLPQVVNLPDAIAPTPATGDIPVASQAVISESVSTITETPVNLITERKDMVNKPNDPKKDLTEAAAEVSKNLEAGAEKVADKAKDVKENIVDQANKVTETVAKKVDQAENKFAQVKDSVVTQADKMGDKLADVKDSVVEQAKNFADVAGDNIEEFSDKVSDTIDAGEDQVQKMIKQVTDFLSDLPGYANKYYQEYKSPINVFLLVLVAFIGLRILGGVLGVINSIPLVAFILELVGVCYTGWFVYRYLLKADTRKELSDKITSIKNDFLGQS